MLSVIESKADIPNMIRSWFPDWNGSSNVICPFHGDHNASLHVSQLGAAKCYGCDFKARSIIDLHAKMNDLTYMQARTELYESVVNAIPMVKVEKMEAALRKNKAAIKYIEKKRNIPLDVAEDFHLGVDPFTGRISIPIVDQYKTCVNIRLMAWDRDSRDKAINTKGHGEIRLYPEWLMVDEKKILLCEGEWDCLVARSRGIPAVTWTGGSGGINRAYLEMFEGKVVYILYDNDKAGIDGAEAMALALHGRSAETVMVKPSIAAGKDLTDWSFTAPDYLNFIKLRIERHMIPHNTAIKHCPTCGQRMP
jgi:DNA primase